MDRVLVIETETGYEIRCRNCGWHEFPKAARPGATWHFNGDVRNPTFTPSMNELLKLSEAACVEDRKPDRRCHFIVTNGMISYCGDCTHELRGQTFPLEPWPEAKVLMARMDLAKQKQG